MSDTQTRAFCVDEDYDRANAGDGRSRYRSYLDSRSHLFVEDGEPVTDPLVFAATVFTIANSPVMSPGYVRQHPRIRAVSWCWDDDHRIGFDIHLPAPLPAPVATALRGQDWADWQRDWRSDWWWEPYDNDRPAAYTVLIVRVPLPVDILPAPVYRDGVPDLATAKTAVAVVCDQLNTHLAGILTALNQR